MEKPKDKNRMVALFATHTQAENAVKEMQHSGFDMNKLSIVGRNYQTEESVVGYYNTSDRVMLWGKRGVFWGGLWGLLVGSAFFVVPGVGPLVIAGQFAATIVGVLEGTAIVAGLSILGGALFSIGIPKDSIVQYEAEIKAGKFALIAHGTTEELQKARDIAKTSGANSTADFGSLVS